MYFIILAISTINLTISIIAIGGKNYVKSIADFCKNLLQPVFPYVLQKLCEINARLLILIVIYIYQTSNIIFWVNYTTYMLLQFGSLQAHKYHRFTFISKLVFSFIWNVSKTQWSKNSQVMGMMVSYLTSVKTQSLHYKHN